MNPNSRTTLAAGISLALGAWQAHAATIPVTNTDDSGSGSLRDALAQANANMEADTIDMSAVSGQTINLTSGELITYNDDVTIEGYDVTVDAGGNSRVLSGYYTALTINDLTITGGAADSGAGIYNKYGPLTLNNATITGNTASGLGGGVAQFSYAGYDVDISESEISGNTAADGGGLVLYHYAGALSVQDSVITGNTAVGGGGGGMLPNSLEWPGNGPLSQARGSDGAYGGALMLSYFGDVSVQGSTISGNNAGGSFGGLLAIGYYNVALETSTVSGNTAGSDLGGAGLLSKYDLAITNSTVSGNSAAGTAGGLYTLAGYYGSGSTVMQFATVTGNDAGSQAGGLIAYNAYAADSLNGSVISGNTAPTDPDVGIYGGSTINANYSLVGNAPSSGTFNTDATSSDLLGQDPRLGPLADNGGPTRTHLATTTESPILDVIPDDGTVGCGTTFTTDQRGEPRPQLEGCDLGSVEAGEGEVLPPAPAIPALDRTGLVLLAGVLAAAGLLGYRRHAARGG